MFVIWPSRFGLRLAECRGIRDQQQPDGRYMYMLGQIRYFYILGYTVGGMFHHTKSDVDRIPRAYQSDTLSPLSLSAGPR